MARPSKLPVNPTSMGKTIYLCVMMSLLALNHLLDDHPRHVQYRKAQQCATARAKANSPLSMNATQTEPSTSAPIQHHHPSPADPKTKWPYPRDKSKRGDRQGGATSTGPSTLPRTPMPPSTLQMSDAWSRMRAATILPSERTKGARRRKKRVSWGDMEVFEYDE